MDYKGLTPLIEEKLAQLAIPQQPAELYEPVRYMLSIGGKRLRPILVLAGCLIAGGELSEALQPALGIEVFHNFTLLHDDIMDNAPLRRNHATVHHRWNSNIAILSGDVMYTLACKLINNAPDKVLRKVSDVFYSTAAAVCEGQQMDMNFEQVEDVRMELYLQMIRLKTAVLLGASLQIGALCGGAGEMEAETLFTAGCAAGMAFQIQDDLLDVFGDSDSTGKRKGGDIASNKKTILRIIASQKASSSQMEELNYWYNQSPADPTEKIMKVTKLFTELNVLQDVSDLVGNYFLETIHQIQHTNFANQNKLALIEFLSVLRDRKA